jgi:hypothetical protein
MCGIALQTRAIKCSLGTSQPVNCSSDHLQSLTPKLPKTKLETSLKDPSLPDKAQQIISPRNCSPIMQRELVDDKAQPYVNLVLANVSDTAEPLIIPFWS